MFYEMFSNLSVVIVSSVLISLGITAIAVKWTEYQVKDLKEKLENKEELSEEDKLLLDITKEYLENMNKVK